MTGLNYIFDGNRDNFRQLVVENSRKGVVLVNYWKPGAGPCLKLWQTLEALSKAYQGRFLRVNINTDTQASLVRDNAITSVPTLKIYSRGDIVESLYGAQPESLLREAIDRHLPPAQDTAIARAIQSYQSGRINEALQVLAEACAEQADNPKLHATAIKLMLRERRYADIADYAAALPDELRTHPEISTLAVHAEILQLAQDAPPAEQLDARLQADADDLECAMSRAALAMVNDDYEMALERLLEILRRDRHYRNELPRKAMLAIFSILGRQHALTRSYQNAMQEILL